jgi:Contractile injection system tube protein
MTLEKAILTSQDGGQDIEFMFNPTQLAFEGVVETAESSGARTEGKGKPKVSFSHVKSYKVTISNIMFDTYEKGENVLDKYINKFKKSVEFAEGKERPPVYQFRWGSQVYLRRCFVEKLSYKLTMFLPNGTPVRAIIDSLSLKEADEPKPSSSLNAKNPSPKNRQADNLDKRRNNKK